MIHGSDNMIVSHIFILLLYIPRVIAGGKMDSIANSMLEAISYSMTTFQCQPRLLCDGPTMTRVEPLQYFTKTVESPPDELVKTNW